MTLWSLLFGRGACSSLFHDFESRELFVNNENGLLSFAAAAYTQLSLEQCSSPFLPWWISTMNASDSCCNLCCWKLFQVRDPMYREGSQPKPTASIVSHFTSLVELHLREDHPPRLNILSHSPSDVSFHLQVRNRTLQSDSKSELRFPRGRPSVQVTP